MPHLCNIFIIGVLFVNFSRAKVLDLRIPRSLALGTSSSSYQIEGAWNVSGKGESTWDRFTHAHPEKITDRSNGDISCDSYHKYKEDVQLIKKIGFNFYRFSISWPRILPNGFANEVNEAGIQYYINLTKELLANGIEPVVTMYHWDHPQILEEFGGWTNELMVGWFVDYARIIFEKLGPMVKTFITINEPQLFCSRSYEYGVLAPGKMLANIGRYLCVHNVLKAHATVFHMYDEEFRSEQQGEIGLTTPLSGWVWNRETDASVVDRFFQFSSGWIMHPVHFGDYPEIMKTRIATISKLEGYPFSRLPEFSEEWIQYIKGTADFYGLNHYSSKILTPDPDEEFGVYNFDDGIIRTYNESWPLGSLSWMRFVPEGFGNSLRMIRDQYSNPPVYIFENGWADTGESNDLDRIRYCHSYLKELLSAVKEDGCNVRKYSAWSLLNSFEWSTGYEPKFGLVDVNFTDPDRKRTPKRSATWWQSVAETRLLQEVPVENTNITFESSSGRMIPLSKSSGPKSYWDRLFSYIQIERIRSYIPYI